MDAWLRANYARGTVAQTASAFNAEFGTALSASGVYQRASRLGLRKPRHSEERSMPAERTVRWSREPEMEAWMLDHDRGQHVDELAEEFERAWGFRLNRSQVSGFRSSHGTQSRRNHGGGKPRAPLGAERPGSDGYTLVKVAPDPVTPQSKDNWRLKHVVVWEREFGPVPQGCSIWFGDRDKSNFDPANLVAVPRSVQTKVHQIGYSDAESLRAAVALAQLEAGVRNAEHSAPRKCGVCGREFTERPDQRGYPRPVQTCPECLAAHRQARGDRGDKKPTVCRVCGKVFPRSQKNQVRCPECIAAGRLVGVDDRRRKHGKG